MNNEGVGENTERALSNREGALGGQCRGVTDRSLKMAPFGHRLELPSFHVDRPNLAISGALDNSAKLTETCPGISKVPRGVSATG